MLWTLATVHLAVVPGTAIGELEPHSPVSASTRRSRHSQSVLHTRGRSLTLRPAEKHFGRGMSVIARMPPPGLHSRRSPSEPPSPEDTMRRRRSQKNTAVMPSRHRKTFRPRCRTLSTPIERRPVRVDPHNRKRIPAAGVTTRSMNQQYQQVSVSIRARPRPTTMRLSPTVTIPMTLTERC